jgi:hypothetical protein
MAKLLIKRSIQKTSLTCVILFIVLLASKNFLLVNSYESAHAHEIVSNRKIYYPTQVNVTTNFSKVIGTNNISLGSQIDREWLDLDKFSELHNDFNQCKFRLIRVGIYYTSPCLTWNETYQTGTYDWSRFDTLLQILHDMEVEIMIVIGNNNPSLTNGGLPIGMEKNYNNTGFPNPVSFSKYCKDIAVHIHQNGWSVKYWELYNEPYGVFEDEKFYEPLIENAYNAFVELFNSASEAILEIFPDALFGTDISNIKTFFNRFVFDGKNVGFLSFHKYDAWGTWLYRPEGYLPDNILLLKASILGNKYLHTPQEMRAKWYDINNVMIPVFCTETNLNSAYINGTDPRIQEVINAVWYAEELIAFISSDVRYSIYFHFASDDSPYWIKSKKTMGGGFGMINKTSPFDKWYPYHVNYLLGNNLHVGDKLFSCTSSNSTIISTLSWVNNNTYHILLVGKTNNSVNINIDIKNANPKNEIITMYKIDKQSTELQVSEENYTNNIDISEKGYFVLMLKIDCARAPQILDIAQFLQSFKNFFLFFFRIKFIFYFLI